MNEDVDGCKDMRIHYAARDLHETLLKATAAPSLHLSAALVVALLGHTGPEGAHRVLERDSLTNQ